MVESGAQMRHLSRRANQVLKLAHKAAQEYGLGYVGTEHLLLGIVREGTSLGGRMLLDEGATEDRIKAAVDELVKQRLDETWVTGRLPGTPHFVNVFSRADRIAKRLKHVQICAEHLLAALLTEGGCVGCEVLRMLGISREIVDQALHEEVPASWFLTDSVQSQWGPRSLESPVDGETAETMTVG